MMSELREAVERLREWSYKLNRDDATQLVRDYKVVVDAYLAEHRPDDDEPVTVEWLWSVGALPDGEVTGQFGIRLWDFNEEESHGEHPAFHIVVSLVDHSVWLESYDTNGKSQALIELPEKATYGRIRQLCRALGIELQEKP